MISSQAVVEGAIVRTDMDARFKLSSLIGKLLKVRIVLNEIYLES